MIVFGISIFCYLNYIYPFNLGGWNNIKGDLGYAERTLDEFDLIEVRRNGQGLVYYSRLEIELSNTPPEALNR